MDTDICNILQDNNIEMDKASESLSRMSSFVVKYIQSGISNEFVGNLENNYLYISKVANKLSIYDKVENQKPFILGYVMALFEVQSIYRNENKNDDIYSSELFGEYKYLKDFILLLYDENVVSHSRLSEVLNIRGSTLSNFLDRIKYLNCFTMKKYGRKRFYYITDIGRKLYKVLCDYANNQSTSLSSENVTDFILQLLTLIINEAKQKNPDKENLLSQLSNVDNCPYITKPNLFCEYIDQLVKTIRLRKTNTYIVCRTESNSSKFLSVREDNQIVFEFDQSMQEDFDNKPQIDMSEWSDRL